MQNKLNFKFYAICCRSVWEQGVPISAACAFRLVEGISFILFNISKGTAFQYQGVANCDFLKLARYNLH